MQLFLKFMLRRLSISDVIDTVKVPESIKQDWVMISGCMGGAEYVDDMKILLVI